MGHSIDIEDAPAWAARLGPEMKSAVVRGLRSAALRGVQDIVGRIIPSRSPVPFDRGFFRAGWKAIVDIPDGADIENAEPHAPFVEGGVRARNVKIGRAMLDALAAWAKRKGIVGKRAAANEQRSIAFAIAKNLQKRGIFRGGKGMEVLKELVEQHLPAIIDEEIRRELEKEWTK